MRNVIRLVVWAAMLFSMFVVAGTASAAEQKTGPTPFPSNDADWPGKGVVRKFGWMVDNRNYFWTQRQQAQGSVVFVGDSLTGNWGNIGEAFPKLKVANRGIGGDVSRGVLFRFEEDVLDLNPKAVVVLIGTNDLTARGNPADAASNIADILAMAAKKSPQMPVVLCTTPPSAHPQAPVSGADRLVLNEKICAMAAGKKNVVLCDLFKVMAKPDGTPQPEYFNDDKLHLSPAGNKKWAEMITPIFEQLGVK